jgi:signal transduction histidine kinase
MTGLPQEVFQMTAEALSNVHRHTDSRNVTVGLDDGGQQSRVDD